MNTISTKQRWKSFLSIIATLFLAGHVWFLLTAPSFASQIAKQVWESDLNDPNCVMNGGAYICESADFAQAFFYLLIPFGIYLPTLLGGALINSKLRHSDFAISFRQILAFILGITTVTYLIIWLT